MGCAIVKEKKNKLEEVKKCVPSGYWKKGKAKGLHTKLEPCWSEEYIYIYIQYVYAFTCIDIYIHTPTQIHIYIYTHIQIYIYIYILGLGKD